MKDGSRSLVQPLAQPSLERQPLGRPMRRPEAWLWAALLLTALVLQTQANLSQSLTGDGAVHLIAGHQALRYGENLVNWEHPPLVKLVMAIPASLGGEPLLEPIDAKDSLAAISRLHERPETLLRAVFLGRALVQLLIVVPGLLACFAIARRFAGTRGGLTLVLLLTLSFSILPHFALLQTDGGAFAGYAVTLWLCLRYLDRPGSLRALALGAALGAGMAAKFSVVLLIPTVALAFFLATGDRTIQRRLRDAALAAAAATLALLSTYWVANRNLSQESQQRILEQFANNQATLIVADRLQDYVPLLRQVGEYEPALAQYLTGFLGIRIQNEIGVYPSYAFGEVSSRGRWWYFPVLAAVKIPLAVLLGLAFTLPGQRDRWRRWPKPDRGLLLSAVLIYGTVALLSNYNIGFRHLLPILPVLFLPLSAFLADRPRPALALLCVLALESLILSPLWISSTNTWWLGSRNPTRFVFSDGNLEYSQNFLALAEALTPPAGRAPEPIGILFPGKDTTMLSAYIPGAYAVPPGAVDLAPGLYGVSVLVEQYVPAMKRSSAQEVHGHDALVSLTQELEKSWNLIRRGEDLGYVAGTFHLFRITAADTVPRTP